MNDTQRWREAYAQATSQLAHDCLAPDELLAALAGRLDGPRHERALQALAECPRCAAVAQIARDLQAGPDTASPRDAVAGAVARPPLRRAWPLRWAGAAAAVLVLGLAGLLLMPARVPEQIPEQVLRGAADAAVTPASGSALRAAPAQLSWSTVDQATAYRVEIFDAAAESLWRSERVAATSLELPADLRARLGRGTYLWRVRAEHSAVELGPFYFRIEP